VKFKTNRRSFPRNKRLFVLCFKWFYSSILPVWRGGEKYNWAFDGSSDSISYRAGM